MGWRRASMYAETRSVEEEEEATMLIAQDSVGQVNGFEVTECGKGGSGSRWGSIERDFQGQVVGGDRS
jgi:hypothetical protein